MCDYSLDFVASRPAKISDKLVSTQFNGSITRGFAAVGEPEIAVCLLPGTELAFEKCVEYEPRFHLFHQTQKTAGKVAQFRQVNTNQPHTHHDALEFPDGQIVLLTRLRPGQVATVLQLPTLAAKHSQLDKESNPVAI
jgi:protein tyrosine phosphatase